ncbi:DUF6192 family protein [Streptomyces violascens]|nr:DUF6192 family protein [Streptomyces violascens]
MVGRQECWLSGRQLRSRGTRRLPWTGLSSGCELLPFGSRQHPGRRWDRSWLPGGGRSPLRRCRTAVAVNPGRRSGVRSRKRRADRPCRPLVLDGARPSGLAHDIHRILAGLEDRFEVIKNPPLHERWGRHVWTQDAAKRRVGWQVSHPRSPQEKVEAVHDLVVDDAVAAQVATDLLRRPEVAARAMVDGTARHLANQAQMKRIEEAGEAFRDQSPAAPAVRRLERAIEFLDLVGACQAFVAASGRIVPRLRDRTLSSDEQAIVHKNVDKVKATCEWIETAVDTGEVDADEALVRLLRGQ